MVELTSSTSFRHVLGVVTRLPQFATRGVLSVANTAYRRLVERSGLVRYSGDECLRRLRELCVALSGVSERVSHGEPSWFVKKQFVTLADHHHDDRFGFWAAAPQGAQERWIALDDGRFFRPPYVGGRGWIGVYLDVEQDWDDIAEIVGDAHAVVAPKRGGR